MSFFKKLFGGSSNEGGNGQLSSQSKQKRKSVKTVSFGRYTDCNKDKDQLVFWNNALANFKEKKYVDSFENFLNYAKDIELNNISIVRNADSVSFEIIQGSRKITGIGDGKDFVAETTIAEMGTHSIPVMRKLMAINYGLKYSKFALNGSTLCMKFSSHAIDASPNKLYAALRELSKKADQQDDLLLGEFSVLKEVDTEHVLIVDEQKREVKYAYLMKLINDTKAEVAALDTEKMAGGISFLLLDLSYKIDYLICPQGLLTDALEKIQTQFFAKGKATTAERNKRIIAEYENLLGEPKEKILEGLYDVTCTFGIPNSATHKTVMDMMFKEREKIGWYRDNGHHKIVEAVYGYMVSYAFFNYGMVYPMTNLLNIAMHVLNSAFYKDMGDENAFVDDNGALNSNSIKRAIDGFIVVAKKEYPFISINTLALNYSNKTVFIDSLIVAIDKIDLRLK